MEVDSQHTEQSCSNEQIVKNFYKFYLDNRPNLRSDYNTLTTYSYSYELVEDDAIINTFYIKTDIVIITAGVFEQNAIHHYYSSINHKDNIRTFNITINPQSADPLVVRAFFFKWGNYHILNIVAATCGSYTIGGSADISRFVMDCPYLFPVACIAFGVCYGTRYTSSTIGDTILSESVYPYRVDKDHLKNPFETNDNAIFRLSNSLKDRLTHDIFDKFLLSKDVLGFNVIMGNYITGESVTSSNQYTDVYTNLVLHSVFAGEQIGYGMFKECRGWKYRIPCIIVKSIYDWGIETDLHNEHNDVEFQEKFKSYCKAFASVHSSIVLNKLIERKVFGKTLPELVKKELLQLRTQANHAIKYDVLEEILNNIMHQKYHSEELNIPLSDLLLNRLHEENIIEIIRTEQSNKETRYVRIVEN